jgi:hypothetical protein
MNDAAARQASDVYASFGFCREELAAAMRSAWDELIQFVTTPAFKAVHEELMTLPEPDRPGFVARVLLSREELQRRGVDVPADILIQTSAFGDRRPTLFAVKKLLPTKYHAAWQNVNITVDNKYSDDQVSRDPSTAWRPPLPVALQNAALAGGLDLETLP